MKLKDKREAKGLNWSPSAKTTSLVGILAGLGQILPSNLSAEGFRNPPPGVFNLGRAGGRFAHVDDASAVTQNPANLMDLKSLEAQISANVVYMKVDYEGANGTDAETTDPWKFLPNLFVATPIKKDVVAAGLALTTPYGLGNEWEESGAFNDPFGWRYSSAFFAELKTININPTVAVRLHETLQLGAGLDVMWSELTLKQFYPWFLATGSFLSPDGVAKAKGDGVGWGGNVGLTWEPVERHRIALTYRSPITVDYEGDVRINNVPPPLGGGAYSSEFESTIDFPTIVGVGYGYEVNPKLRVEVNFEWLEFSRFDSLPLETGGNPFLPSMEIEQDWHNTFTAGIGGDWKFSENWVLRAGYQFYESPVPEWTFSPSIPDANQHVFTVGLGYKIKQHSFEIAYGADFYDQRDIERNQNPAYEGEYDITVHLFALGYRFSF